MPPPKTATYLLTSSLAGSLGSHLVPAQIRMRPRLGVDHERPRSPPPVPSSLSRIGEWFESSAQVPSLNWAASTNSHSGAGYGKTQVDGTVARPQEGTQAGVAPLAGCGTLGMELTVASTSGCVTSRA